MKSGRFYTQVMRNRSGGCKPPSLKFASVVVVKGWTEFVEAHYETRSDCHRVACDG